MSAGFKEKSTEFIKNVKETDFKEKGAEFVKSVKENETIHNTIDNVGKGYDSLKKKQGKRHIVEWMTGAIILTIIGIVIPRLAILTYLAIGCTIYIFVSYNNLVALQENVDTCYSNLGDREENYKSSLGENIIYFDRINARIPGAFNHVNVDAGEAKKMREALDAAQTEYNEAVMAYNYHLRAFPSSISAYVWGFTPAKLRESDVKKDYTVRKTTPDIDISDVF